MSEEMTADEAVREIHQILEIPSRNVRPAKVVHYVKLLDAHHWEHHRLGDARLEHMRTREQRGVPRLWEKRPEPETSPYRHLPEVEAQRPEQGETEQQAQTRRRKRKTGRDRQHRGGFDRSETSAEPPGDGTEAA